MELDVVSQTDVVLYHGCTAGIFWPDMPVILLEPGIS